VWAALAVPGLLLAGAALVFLLRSMPTSSEKSISLKTLSGIHEEQARARKEFSEFLGTPAGKIWEKHPYWDPETCRKIAAGEVEPGMSREQARAALGEPVEIKFEKSGEALLEKWRVEGREKWVLTFEANALKNAEKK
jgi:hypothetical protein